MIQICDHKLLIFNLLLIMSVVACEMKKILTFTAHERGKVEILCPYEPGYETKNKYLCRGKCTVGSKDIPVESGSAAKDERFSLTDNTTTHIFTVTITDLRTDDKGQYWCAVKTGWGYFDAKTEILLEVQPVSVVSAVTGEHLNIICRYESDVKNDVKFICRGSDPSLCETSGIKVSSKKPTNGRFSLRDEASAGVFTVTITDLTPEDSGIYWCGAGERGHKNKNKWISVTDLNFHDVTSERTSPKHTSTASDHTSKPTAETASDRPVTSVFPLSSSSTSPSVISPLSNNSVSPEPEPGFLMLVLLVVVGILTGFGFSLFMYFRWRQKKEGRQPRDDVQGPTEHLPNRDMDANREAAHVVSDYEEICNTLDHPDYSLALPVFDEHDASVYALAQLPRSPSDELNYSTVKFSATHHSDRTSDGQETCDYATVMP